MAARLKAFAEVNVGCGAKHLGLVIDLAGDVALTHEGSPVPDGACCRCKDPPSALHPRDLLALALANCPNLCFRVFSSVDPKLRL